MEPPPPPATSAAAPPLVVTSTAVTNTTVPTYPESQDSSPRSRATDFDDSFPSSTAAGKLRLMCSYGGHIVPRPHDKSLCYVGGDTRIVVVDRSTTFADLLSRLSKTLINGRPFTLKYQLPNEDLDSLISISTEEDLDNMVDEYDRLVSNSNSAKPSRIRLFLFPAKPETASSIGSILDSSNRSEDWFLNALNGAAAVHRGFSTPASVNCLLGLEENGVNYGNNSETNKETMMDPTVVTNAGGGEGKKSGNNLDVHSVPDSPIVESSSSFGSTSSSPSLANLPPIRVHVEEGSQRVGAGIEEQFAQMGVSNVQKQQSEEGFVVIPATLPPTPVIVSAVPAGEFVNRVFSDDERSDHGAHGASYRKPQQQPPIGQPVAMNSQPQQKQMVGSELPSPDSVSSDSSLSNAISRQKTLVYQDPSAQISSGNNRLPANFVDPNTRIQVQQFSETGYAMAAPQYDQQHQFLQQQHLQQQQQQQQQQPQGQGQGQGQPQQAHQQYIPAGAHFVHHPPPGAMPMSTYFPMYQPQQAHHHHPHQQYQVYYVPAGQAQAPPPPAQAYALPVQQQQSSNMGEPVNPVPSSRAQAPPNPTLLTTATSAYNNPPRNTQPPKPEMGVYRTPTPPVVPTQLVQVPPPQQQPPQQLQHQQQFMGYSQIHHQSQSIAPNSVGNASGGGGGYAYEYGDHPAHSQIYYTQPLGPTMATQYQAGPTMVMTPEGSSPHANDNLKQQQQIRTSQPL